MISEDKSKQVSVVVILETSMLAQRIREYLTFIKISSDEMLPTLRVTAQYHPRCRRAGY
jgi:hypothetical protein